MAVEVAVDVAVAVRVDVAYVAVDAGTVSGVDEVADIAVDADVAAADVTEVV